MKLKQQQIKVQGINLQIYKFLWNTKLKEKSYQFRMPHTVIYREGVAQEWLYCNVEKRIVRKQKGSMKNSKIQQVFLDKKSDSFQYIAYYLYLIQNQSKCIFIQKQHFHLFINTNHLHTIAILQKIHLPTPQIYQNIIQSDWNNLKPFYTFHDDFLLFKNSLPVSERTRQNSKKVLSMKLKGKINNFVEQIMKNIDKIYRNVKVYRMRLFFRVNNKGQLVFLFSSQIHLQQQYHYNKQMIQKIYSPQLTTHTPIHQIFTLCIICKKNKLNLFSMTQNALGILVQNQKKSCLKNTLLYYDSISHGVKICFQCLHSLLQKKSQKIQQNQPSQTMQQSQIKQIIQLLLLKNKISVKKKYSYQNRQTFSNYSKLKQIPRKRSQKQSIHSFSSKSKIKTIRSIKSFHIKSIHDLESVSNF